MTSYLCIPVPHNEKDIVFGCAGCDGPRRSLRSGGVVERSYPISKEWLQHRRRRTERSYSTFKVRRGGSEEIPSSTVRSRGCALLEQR